MFVACCLALPSFARNAELESLRASLQKDRQQMVASNLGLSEQEGAAFWPVYRSYRMEMSRIGDRLVKLISDYDDRFDSLTDADATRMLDEYFSIQSSELALRKKYVTQFRKVLPPKKVGRFYQIENKLDAAVRYGVSEMVPLAK
jgi:UTP:GlnB (protein PII) uridylyltransferase